ncbi:serine hydrolase domain-containing protein [Kribbella sp. CA-247076]|uniref:serine hydrolase domain-containing protein n=1 Tax=Kribbella sp. CA-247076 TaxID=3239941 RepID=UPI003D94A61E
MSDSGRPPARTWTTPARVVSVVLALAVLVAGFLVRPTVPEPDRPSTGDEQLRQTIDRLYDGPRHRLAVALVDRDGTRFAGFGTDEHDVFEIGSISKAFTGLLLADSVQRREVRLDQPVGQLLPLGEAPVGQVTLEELASHRSGLPRLAPSVLPQARGLLARFTGADPYPYTVEELLDHAHSADVDGRGEAQYSNLGGALLGQALAKAAETEYDALLTERLLRPSGMTATRLPSTEAQAAPKGYSTGGRQEDPWLAGGYAPAGGAVSTAADLAALAQRLLETPGPLATALEPRHEYDGEDRIGLHWITSPLPETERSMVWHNGGTGGYRSFLALDRDRGRAVVVLSDVASDVDDLGADLLREA